MEEKPDLQEGCEEEVKAKYINPFTDFGFKKLFGEEGSKYLLIDFLNSLLPLKNEIVDLTFSDKEKIGDIPVRRAAIYDIFCMDKTGKHFIVEMQNAKQMYFKDRAVFYSTFPIREQAEKGEWNFQLQFVYCISLMGFEFNKEEHEYLHEVKLKDQHNEVFYEKLSYIFVELPKFKKTESELENKFEKWLYFLKNLEDFKNIPEILNEDIFKKAFVKAEIANYNEEQLHAYEESLKDYRDYNNTLNTAVLETKFDIVKNALEKEMDEDLIQELTGVKKDQIKEIKNNFEGIL